MAVRFDINHMVETRGAPNRLRNIRAEGWNRTLMEMRAFWGMGSETTFETRFYEKLKNVPRPKKPIENW